MILFEEEEDEVLDEKDKKGFPLRNSFL
jgi:hypothetical protein